MQLWDARSYEYAGPLTGPTNDVGAVAFSPDSTVLATTSDRSIRLWNPRTRHPVADPGTRHTSPLMLAGHTDIIYTAAFSPDSTVLATGGKDHTARLWSIEQRR
ncbi:WD40 repeat domain-containing protein [Nocardia sp. NPDC055053]